MGGACVAAMNGPAPVEHPEDPTRVAQTDPSAVAGVGSLARWRIPAGYVALSWALFMAWWAPLSRVISVEAAGNRAGVGAWLPVDALVGRVSGGVLTLVALGAAFATVRGSRHWGGRCWASSLFGCWTRRADRFGMGIASTATAWCCRARSR